MVLARVLAEMSVLIVLILLPILLQIMGKFGLMPMGAKVVVSALTVISLCILPWFGFITYQVNTDAQGMTTLAVLARHFCEWQAIKGLSRKSSNNWVRYVVEYEGGELSFPTLLKSCDGLVQEIRTHLPGGSGVVANPYRMFKCDAVALLVQALQSAAGIVFVCIGWFLFAGTMMRGGHNGDSAMLAAFCAACTLVFVWRTFVVALMPKTVELTPDQLIVATQFFQRKYPWSEVLSVQTPFPLLPEGFMIKTKKGSYLIGVGMEAGDELEDALRAKVAQHQVKKP
jgi:hypothetical protein